MVVTARYGQGRFNQSLYGNVVISGDCQTVFLSSPVLTALGEVSGGLKKTFLTEATLGASLSGTVSSEFIPYGRGGHGLSGKALSDFPLEGTLSAEDSRVRASVKTVFSSVATSEGIRYAVSSVGFRFGLEGSLYAIGEVKHQGLIEFISKRAVTNKAPVASKIYMRFDLKSDFIFTNKGPSYSTWDRTLKNLSYDTSGYSGLPYVETVFPQRILREETFDE